MQRLFHRVGPWLFLFAVAWYLAGNYWMKSFEQQRAARATERHVRSQSFDVGVQGSVVIRTSEHMDRFRSAIAIRFDPNATQATVKNENWDVSVNGQLVDGVLQIVLSRTDRSGYRPANELRVVLPGAVSRVGVEGENSFDISGRLSNPKSTLVLENLQCSSTVTVKGLSVKQLKLLSMCQVSASEKPDECCHARFVIEPGAELEKLEVSMLSGALNFQAYSIPQTELNLGDSVEVRARRAFLQAARFGKPPQSPAP